MTKEGPKLQSSMGSMGGGTRVLAGDSRLGRLGLRIADFWPPMAQMTPMDRLGGHCGGVGLGFAAGFRANPGESRQIQVNPGWGGFFENLQLGKRDGFLQPSNQVTKVGRGG